MPVQQTTLLSPTELAYLHSSLALSPPIRPDARSPTTFRPLIAETDLLPLANGSARLCFADGMEGIVGVKAEVERSKGAAQSRGLGGHKTVDEDTAMGGITADEDSERARELRVEDEWVEVTIDMPGQRDDDSVVIFLARMIHEGLVSDGTLPKRLQINGSWHWKLYIDVRRAPVPQNPNPLSVSENTNLKVLIDLTSLATSNLSITAPLPIHASRPSFYAPSCSYIDRRRGSAIQR